MAPTQDYEGMSQQQLQQEAQKRGVSLPQNASEQQIRKALKEQDKSDRADQ